VGSNPIGGMHTCEFLFLVFLVLCVGSSLATGWSPVQRVLPTADKVKRDIEEKEFFSNTYFTVLYRLRLEIHCRIHIWKLLRVPPTQELQHYIQYSWMQMLLSCCNSTGMIWRNNFGFFLSLEKTPTSILENSDIIEVKKVYIYIDISLRNFLCTPAFSCSAERSFRWLRRLKGLKTCLHLFIAKSPNAAK
jgi:hypothetical protein